MLTNVILSAAQGHPVFINEYVHGYAKTLDLLAYYRQKTPLGKVLTQTLLTFMMMLWLSFAPWKPRPKVSRAVRQVPMEGFIDSMAGIYFRARAASLVLSPMLDDIERLLRRRHRMGLADTPRVRALLEGLFTGHERAYSEHEALSTALQKARQIVARRQSLPPHELLKISRQLLLIQETLRHGRRSLKN